MRCSSAVIILLALAAGAAGSKRELQILEDRWETISIPYNIALLGVAGGSDDLPYDHPLVVKRVSGVSPEQVHLTYNSPTAVTISWVTGEYQLGPDVTPTNTEGVKSMVYYEALSPNVSMEATGFTTTYQQIYNFTSVYPNLNYSSAVIHHTQLTDLEPATLYFYMVGNPILGLSNLFNFTTGPELGEGYPLRFGVLADVGMTYNSSTTVEHLMTNDPDLVLLIGDYTYADDHQTNGSLSATYLGYGNITASYGTYQPQWDAWGRLMEPVIAHRPMLGIPGNHEIESQQSPSSSHRKFQSWIARYGLVQPYNLSGSPSPLFYSAEYGPAHVLFLNSYTDFEEGSEQYDWLLEDLAAVDRLKTPWLLAAFHAPWYETHKSHYREAECVRQALEVPLYEAGVDIVFSGHVHAYERTHPMFNYTIDPCGPVHLLIGDAGNVEKVAFDYVDEPGQCPPPALQPAYQPQHCPAPPYEGGQNDGFCPPGQPEWSAFREKSFGHAILDIHNATHALWSWNRNQDVIEVSADHVFLTRNSNECENKRAVPVPALAPMPHDVIIAESPSQGPAVMTESLG